MNTVRINPSPFKGEVGRGMGLSGGYFVDQTAVRAPSPPYPVQSQTSLSRLSP